jgi:hypothetical protein
MPSFAALPEAAPCNRVQAHEPVLAPFYNYADKRFAEMRPENTECKFHPVKAPKAPPRARAESGVRNFIPNGVVPDRQSKLASSRPDEAADSVQNGRS